MQIFVQYYKKKQDFLFNRLEILTKNLMGAANLIILQFRQLTI